MTHLGTWVSALVDGQLSPAETERALAHVAACGTCADEVAAARQARRALAVTRDVAPDPDLTARLLALGSTGVPAPGARPGRSRPVVPLGESAYAVPAKALSGDLMGRRRSPARLVTAAVGGAAVLLAVLFVLGDRPPVVPATHPAEALTALGRAPQGTASTATSAAGRTAGATGRGVVTTLALTSPADDGADGADGAGRRSPAAVMEWMAREGWSCPAALPAGYEVTAVQLTPADDDAGTAEVLELDLAGPHGRVVLTEQQGRLDVTALGPVGKRTLGGRTVYVLSLHPWHAVWQSDDVVVAMVSEAPQDHAERVVEEFPAHAYDDGVPARLSRGWDTVTGALAIP